MIKAVLFAPHYATGGQNARNIGPKDFEQSSIVRAGANLKAKLRNCAMFLTVMGIVLLPGIHTVSAASLPVPCHAFARSARCSLAW